MGIRPCLVRVLYSKMQYIYIESISDTCYSVHNRMYESKDEEIEAEAAPVETHLQH